MKGSGISSATAIPSPRADGPASPPGRRRVALDGRSVALDPATHAVRPDLADIRLADRVFAPHYAAPVRGVVTRAVALRQDRGAGAAVVATLAAGAAFETLDVVAGDAWGVAEGPIVGYVEASALAPA